ncbi:MAG: hypothetical protein KDB14_15600 [Planctomycetales bacterium]|nr:hypothetical protein [Planctomycetales bacterium]
MATNKEIDADEFRAALATAAEEILGTQIEPGSLADRLLRQGREEGQRRGELIGRLQLLSELLGEPCSADIGNMSLEELQALAQDLQLRLARRR